MVTESDVKETLRKCFDPEIHLSVLDLGLVEKISIEGERVCIDLVLTNPNCPLHSTIVQDVYSKVIDMKGVSNAEVNILTEVQWKPSRLSEEAKKALGA